MTIELRLTDVDPPAAEPKRTIYRDIVNLPDPVKLGITVRYFNYDDVGLYFQITGSGTGYTFGTVNLGLLGSGSNAYINLDEFASKTKPSTGDLPNGELEENITLTLKAYTDSGYSNLKWTYERIVTVHWINSADAAFTQDVLNNFDDGTVQGWSGVIEADAGTSGSTTLTVAVATDYVLSASYSLKATYEIANNTQLSTHFNVRFRLEKAITTPNKSTVFAIIDMRDSTYVNGANAYTNIKNDIIRKNGDVLIYIGRPYDTVNADYVPINKWMRMVVPLPANTSLTLKIIVDGKMYNASGAYRTHQWLAWLDDFKIISK